MEAYLGLASVPVVMALIALGRITCPQCDHRIWGLAALAVAMVWNTGLSWLAAGDVAASVPIGVLSGLAAAGVLPSPPWAVVKKAVKDIP